LHDILLQSQVKQELVSLQVAYKLTYIQ